MFGNGLLSSKMDKPLGDIGFRGRAGSEEFRAEPRAAITKVDTPVFLLLPPQSKAWH